MNFKRCLILLALLPCLAVAAENRVVGDFAFSTDSDGQDNRSADAGFERKLKSLGQDGLVAVRAGHLQLSDSQERSKFTTLRLETQLNLDRAITVSAHVNPLFGSWSPFFAGGALSYRLTPRWSLDISGDADLVDTARAAQRRTRVSTFNFTSDYAVSDEVTLTGGVLEQIFSDGNRRTGGLLRAVYSPSWLQGFNIQLRGRRLDADFNGVGYFSPDRLEEGLLLLQYGHPLPGDRWVLTGIVGGGAQRINGTDTSAIYRAELRSRGWFSDHLGLEGKIGCTNTGGLQVQTSPNNYRYCYGTMSLIGAW